MMKSSELRDLLCYRATRNLEAPMKVRRLAAALVLFAAGSYLSAEALRAKAEVGPYSRSGLCSRRFGATDPIRHQELGI